VSLGPAHELAVLIRSGWRLISFETFEEDRALRVIERVAEGLERKPMVWTSASGFAGSGEGAGDLEYGIAAIQNVPEPAIFVLLDAHEALRSAVTTRKLRDLLPLLGKRRQVVLMVGAVTQMPVELVREAGYVGMPLPRADELESLFRRVLDQADGPADPEFVGACVRSALGLTAAEAVRVVRKATALSEGLNAQTASHIVREKSLALRRTPALAFHDTDEGLERVGGLDALKSWLRERRRAFGEEARAFGLPLPRGLLLLGVQGCGKSLSAKSVAVEWGFPLLRLDLASVFAGGSQSPEAAIKEAISVAESISPAVLWIDEIEKGFAATDRDSHASRVFGSFLTWLSEKTEPVFVVATANEVAGLPPELLRRGRFDELFFVDLPTTAERIEILAIHLRKRDRDPSQFQLEQLAEEAERLSGGELEQVVSAGLYAAFAEDRDLTDNDLLNAIHETIPLYDTYEDKIKDLRDWARTRARAASTDSRVADLFAR
jgi:ATP-dependent 26S proteasome regulatory subunit